MFHNSNDATASDLVAGLKTGMKYLTNNTKYSQEKRFTRA
jgi:hypothetical protein